MDSQAQSALPEQWRLCQPDELAKYVRPETGTSKEGPIQFQANTAQSSSGEAILKGNVEVERGDQRLEASEVTMDRLNNLIRAEGNVIYSDPDLAVSSEEGRVDLEEEVGVFHSAKYYLPSRNAQGNAEQVEVSREELESTLKKVTYSTCRRGHEFWQMRTRQLNVNQKTGRGSARNITFALQGVPILYFPYLSFPITDERQSGFLVPRVGYNSDNGFDARIPYYWNIAPNQDMTIAPRILTERGLMLGLEYRFLTPKGQGQIDAEYLPSDQKFGEDRSAIFVSHLASPRPNLYTNLLYQEVSDDEFLDDFGNNLDLLSLTSLDRYLDVSYYGDGWTGLARLQTFQTIDKELFPTPESKPYNRVPQLLFNGAWPQHSNGLSYEMRGELVYFDRGASPTGARLDLLPTLSLPLQRSAWFSIPRLSYRYTAYNLNTTPASGISENPTRGAPIVSIDSGLFLERPWQWQWWGGFNGIQTLEPRLFYLYVPFRDQSDIPIFDSILVDPSYTWLFLENRFTGADRLGDANQLTTALTSRLITNDGQERLRFSVGQIQYFEDRRVTLENTAPEESSNSLLLAETLVQLNPRTFLRGTLQWDADNNNTQRSALDLGYRFANDRLFNFSYRYAQSDDLEQLDLSTLWRIDDQWRTVGRWNYSLKQKRNLDAFIGVEYEECCWALRMLARQHRDSPQDEKATNSFYVQLELKGLTGVGTRINRLLEDIIRGYEIPSYR